MLESWLTTWMEFWQQHWLTLAIFAGFLLAAWLLARSLKWIEQKVFRLVTARSKTTLDDRILERTARPGSYVVLLAGWRMAVEWLDSQLPALANHATWQLVEKVLLAAAILATAFWVLGALNAAMDWYMHEVAHRTESNWDEELIPLLRKVSSIVVLFIAASIILPYFGANITGLVTTAGVASLAVALAAQDTLANMIAGFTIMVDKPFRLGDVIELEQGKAGEVIEIGMRTTKVKLFDGNAMVVPNKDMAATRLVNFALPNMRAAIRQTVGVAYHTDVDKAKGVLLAVMRGHPEVLAEPAPGVFLTNFGDSSLDLFMVCWVSSYLDRFRITDEVNMEIVRRFRAEGIEIPFPQRDVRVHLVDARSSQGQGDGGTGAPV